MKNCHEQVGLKQRVEFSHCSGDQMSEIVVSEGGLCSYQLYQRLPGFFQLLLCVTICGFLGLWQRVEPCTYKGKNRRDCWQSPAARREAQEGLWLRTCSRDQPVSTLILDFSLKLREAKLLLCEAALPVVLCYNSSRKGKCI